MLTSLLSLFPTEGGRLHLQAQHDPGPGESSELCVCVSVCEGEGGDATLPADPEAGVAQALAHLHQRHRGGQPHQREPLPEQHDHPQAAQRGSL